MAKDGVWHQTAAGAAGVDLRRLSCRQSWPGREFRWRGRDCDSRPRPDGDRKSGSRPDSARALPGDGGAWLRPPWCDDCADDGADDEGVPGRHRLAPNEESYEEFAGAATSPNGAETIAETRVETSGAGADRGCEADDSVGRAFLGL